MSEPNEVLEAPSKGMSALGDPELDTPTELEPEETPAGVQDVTPEPEVKPEVAPVIDATSLAKAFGDVISEKFAPKDTPEKKVDELTPEEAKKLLNVWEPTKEWQVKFDNLETREQALQEMRDGVVKHTDTVTQYRLREATAALESKFAPVLADMERRQEQESRNRFNTKYGQLADPALEPLLTSVAEGFRKAGKKFETEEALFDALAGGAEAIIKVSQPDFKITAGSSPATTKPTTEPTGKIPVTTPGAGGGGGGNKGNEKPKPRGLSIFEDK